jgi:hypothetical protein
MLTHLHVMVKHLWCWHIRKGGDKGEEEEALPGSVCYHRGTAMPCPVHRHPCGSDRLRRLRERCSGGAPPPCLVASPPLGGAHLTPPESSREGCGTSMFGVHNHFIQRAGELETGTATVIATP